MQPTVNVNLKPCDCPPSDTTGQRHESSCASTPVLIPCPIPRSVTFEVRLGRCECSLRFTGVTGFGVSEPQGQHSTDCPARPIRAICTISGTTWRDSQVAVCELGLKELQTYSGNDDALYASCRERWALVKALVLGKPVPTMREAMLTLSHQRDAVFSALADMARAEEDARSAQERAMAAFKWRTAPEHSHRFAPSVRASADLLGQYVEHLVEQVGVLE